MIYFLEVEELGLVKIGYAADTSNRLRALRTACPYELKLIGEHLGDRFTEGQVHRRFSHLKAEFGGGREWFHMHKEIADFARLNWEKRVRVWLNLRPVVFGILTRVFDCRDRDECQMVVSCPRCGIEHSHGFKPGLDWGSCSSRCAGCCEFTESDDGYGRSTYFVAAHPDLSRHAVDPRFPLSAAARKEMIPFDQWESGRHPEKPCLIRLPFFERLEV